MIYINIYIVYICFTISTVLSELSLFFLFELVFHMTIYYGVVVQLLRKTREEAVQLLSCCLWRKK